MNTPFDFANYYSDLGWYVFPCKPKDKHPMTEHGLLDATKQKTQIAEWWKRTPNANIGIRTGQESGIFVLDIDFGNGGDESLKRLEEKHGALPKTIINRTGGGGRHFVFAYPKGIDLTISQGKVARGIDTRGNRGYIVAPPSIHDKTGAMYLWDKDNAPSNTPLAPLPEWIIESLLIKDAPTPRAVASEIGQQEGVYPKGTRHAAMVSLAGTMRRRGMTEGAIMAAIMLEAERFIPPATATDIEALKETVRRVSRYEPTAALATTRGGRVQVEWSFCKSMYEFEQNLSDFEWLKTEWFGDKALAAFWDAFLETKNATAAAARSGILEDLERWQDYDPDRIDTYAREISRYGYLDGVATAAANIQRMAFDGNVERISEAIQSLAEKAPHITVGASDANKGLDRLEQMLETGSYIKTGFPHIDEKIGGLEVGGLTILAGRPGMGKTSLSWQLARSAADDNVVFYFSLEMPEWKLWEKAALGIAEVTPADVFNKTVPPEKMELIRKQIIPGLRKSYQGRLYTYDQTTGLDTFFRLATQIQPKVVFVDHLRYIDANGDNEVRRLGLISMRGKQLAVKGDGCNVTMLHQLSRAVTGRDDKAPQLTDLRESGQIEENADQVLMLHRPDYYEMDAEKSTSETHLLVRKNRSGVSEIPFYLTYNLRQQWFYRKSDAPIADRFTPNRKDK